MPYTGRVRGAGLACVVVALAGGCLESPPSATGGGRDAGAVDDAAPGGFSFPPPGARVNIAAALAADVDADGREDLVLVDSDARDEWAGVYVLRAGPAGWSRTDEIRLPFRPTAAHFGRQVTASPSLVVGGASGRVAVVDYEPDDDTWEVSELAFDNPPAGDIRVIHTGVRTSGDPSASLLLDDGADLSLSSPIDTGATMNLSTLVAGGVLDAAYWPLRTTDPVDFIMWRRAEQLEWYDGTTYGGPAPAAVQRAQFSQVDADLCGAYLALGASNALSVGWIACDGSAASFAPVFGYDIPQVRAMTTAHLAGGPTHDIALIGLDADEVVGQVLVDAVLVDDGETLAVIGAASTTVVAIGASADAIHLVPADVGEDDTAVLYAVAPSGAMACSQVGADALVACAAGWQVTVP